MDSDRTYKMKNIGRCANSKKPNEKKSVILTTITGVIFGFLIGVSFPTLSSLKNLQINVAESLANKNLAEKKVNSTSEIGNSTVNQNLTDHTKIWASSNPRGAERLPPNLVVSESDFFLRRLWGKPSEDLTNIPKYLVTFTVGYNQRSHIDAAVKKFSDNFTVLLFHYDGRTTEWDEFEWSKRAIHVSAHKQTKWWYAKRFLHPDIVSPYEYIFIWDEDLGVENFNAEEYIKLVKKHGLEISQPALEPKGSSGISWQMTKRKHDCEVHKETEEKPGWCTDPHLPPCAAFVEIMAPVFSRDSWRCVWHMIQNDLVHGWGLDLALQRCVMPAHEKIGVVDAQPVVHRRIPSLGNEGIAENGKPNWQGVNERCKREWVMFRNRLSDAEKAYYSSIGIEPSNFTAH